MATLTGTLQKFSRYTWLSSACRHWRPAGSCIRSINSNQNVRRFTSSNRQHQTSTFPEITRSLVQDREIPLESITEYVFKHAHKYGNRAALVDALSGETYSYDQLLESSFRVASGLVRHGFTPGDTVMFLSTNSIHYIIVFHAVISLGGIVTFSNPLYPVDDLLTQAKDSHPKFLYCSPDQVDKAKEVAQKLGNIKEIFGDGEGSVSLTTLLADDGKCHPGSVDFDPRERVALLPYSSGTTGLPKGVILTHYNEVANICQSRIEELALGTEDDGAVQIGLLPMYHMFGIWAYFLYGLALGHTIVVVPKFEPEMFLRAMEKYKVSLLFCPPPIVLFMNNSPLAGQYDLSAVRRVAVGAAPLGPQAEEEFRRKCPNAAMGQIYGLSETSPILTCVGEAECGQLSGTIGKAVPNTELKLVDPETNKVVTDTRKTGELWARGPQIMKGYLNKPDATSACIDTEGWFKTGDITYRDDEGNFFVADRLKELIKYKGFQVPPAELEALLCSHPAVTDAGVVGVPDEEAGELPRAYVQLKDGARAEEQELLSFVADRVVAYKKLRGGLTLVDTVPRSAAGKILRRQLKELL